MRNEMKMTVLDGYVKNKIQNAYYLILYLNKLQLDNLDYCIMKSTEIV